MPSPIRVQDLNATEIAEILAADGSQLTPDEAAALQKFIEDIGGFENAFAAVDMLGELEHAA
ncbi:MAG: hypothetical protein GX575_10860 [Candidatus Anammoximicrobium sp.]|nr:hypothetical protein [Candidatus Anammoximicrobium sp.]